MSTVIFDFDGTLADTFPLVVDITYKITHAKRLRPEKIEALRAVPLLQAARSLGGKPWDIPFLILFTRRAMYPRMGEVHAFAGTVAAVKRLRNNGHRLLVLSSNRERNVRAFLRYHGIEDCFSGIYQCSVFRKSAGIRSVIERKRLAARDTYYIGNEAADIDAAQGAGIKAIAAAWSGQDVEALSRSQPQAVAYEPREIIALVTERV